MRSPAGPLPQDIQVRLPGEVWVDPPLHADLCGAAGVGLCGWAALALGTMRHLVVVHEAVHTLSSTLGTMRHLVVVHEAVHTLSSTLGTMRHLVVVHEAVHTLSSTPPQWRPCPRPQPCATPPPPGRPCSLIKALAVITVWINRTV